MRPNFVMSQDGRNLLINAVRAGDLAMVKEHLDTWWDVHKADDTGYTALHFACEASLDVAQALLAHGANPNIERPESRVRPLHGAAYMDNAGVLQCLLAHGAEVDARDAEGQTPLHYAAMSGARDAARLLAQAGAFLDAEDQRGCTPLWHAIDGNNEAVVRLLVESGADANSGLEKPLHLAAEWDCADVVDLLVGHGADVFALDAHGQTASDLAEQTQSLDALERLMSAKRRELARQSRESIQTALGLPDEHARQSRKM